MGSSDLPFERLCEPLSPHSSPPKMVAYESAATCYHQDQEIEARVDDILRLAADEGFEDGMEGRMSRALNLFVTAQPAVATQQLAIRLNSQYMNQGIAADVVRVLGQMKHERSHNERVYIAECLLYSTSPVARDAGAVALGDLADERSVPALQRAIEEEPIPALKADMQESLGELMKDADVVRSP